MESGDAGMYIFCRRRQFRQADGQAAGVLIGRVGEVVKVEQKSDVSNEPAH